MLVGVRVDGRDAGRRGAMNAYKDGDTVLVEMSVQEAVLMAKAMASALGLSEEELSAVIEEVQA